MPIYNNFDYITIDAARIDEACDVYFKWKDLNGYVRRNSTRGTNIPDTISEQMGCYCLDLLWNRGKIAGDATNPRTGEIIEFKATSNFDGDLSSFGPRCQFDDLVFLRFDIDNNLLYVYDLHVDAEEFGSYPANKAQLIRDQQREGRRPHVSLKELFIDGTNMTPDIIFDIRRCEVNHRGSQRYNDLLRD